MKKEQKKEPDLKGKGKKINWNKIKHEYVTGDITYRELAEKYGVSIESIKKEARKTAKRKGWVTLKSEHRHNVYTKAEQETARKQGKELASYKDKAKGHAQRLVDMVGEAISELREYIVEHETTVKETEYDQNVHKPKKETVTKSKDIELIYGKINTKSLKEIAETLDKIHKLLGEKEEDDEESGIIELPPMEVLTPPEDPEEEGAEVSDSG